MVLNRREFLKSNGAVLGTTVLSEGNSILAAGKGSPAEAAGCSHV